MENEIKIMAEPQMNPETCLFTVDRPLIADGPSIRFESTEQAKGSPLAEALFEIGNISQVFVSGSMVALTQSVPEDWQVMGKKVGQILRQVIQNGSLLISEEAMKKIPPSEKIKEKVEEILNQMINPAIAAHGGQIELIDVKHNDVFIRMSGGCQGCASSKATLKQGVERTLRQEIPDLGGIYDVTDHAAGENPFFR